MINSLNNSIKFFYKFVFWNRSRTNSIIFTLKSNLTKFFKFSFIYRFIKFDEIMRLFWFIFYFFINGSSINSNPSKRYIWVFSFFYKLEVNGLMLLRDFPFNIPSLPDLKNRWNMITILIDSKRKLRVKPVANFESLEFLRILDTKKIVVDWAETDLVGMEHF